MAGAPGSVALDEQGRVRDEPGARFDGPEALARAFEPLLCASLGVIAARTIDTPNGYLGIMTLRERSGFAPELWAGAALRDTPPAAQFDAAADALLRPWHRSAVAAGAARLVTAGTCRAAMVIDDSGVTSYGPPTDFPPLGARGETPEAGDRIATRTMRGEFRALSLGGASVMLNVVPGVHNDRRIELWFDALEAALE